MYIAYRNVLRTFCTSYSVTVLTLKCNEGSGRVGNIRYNHALYVNPSPTRYLT